MARDPAEALALWRYHLIAEALDPRLGGRERGPRPRAAPPGTPARGGGPARPRHGVRIAERTLAEQFRRRGFTRGELLRDGRTFGRYEADAPNERWIGDVLVGPFVPPPRAPGSVRARLFVLVD